MTPEWISAICGLVGAIIGGGCTLIGVRLSERRTKRSELLKLLVDQRIRLRSGKLRDLTELTADDHIRVLQAYIDFRSSLLLRCRPLDRVWRHYKGNSDDYLPLFHRISSRQTGEQSTEAISHHPDWKESCDRVNHFIDFLIQ